MSAEQQSTFVETPSGEYVRMAADGRLFRPLLAYPSAIVKECKWRFDADGLSIRAVDKASVCMVELDVPASAFDDYTVHGGEILTACKLSNLRGPLATVRYGKRSADPVAVSMDRTRTSVETEREYDTTAVERTDTFLNIDPDSVRQEPDLPDLEYPWYATVDVDAFKHVADGFDKTHDHIGIQEADGALIMQATNRGDDGSEVGAEATFDVDVLGGEGADGGERSIFSLDYVTDIAAALKTGLADSVTIRWGQEWPVRFEFERSDGDGEGVYAGAYLISPRISPGGD